MCVPRQDGYRITRKTEQTQTSERQIYESLYLYKNKQSNQGFVRAYTAPQKHVESSASQTVIMK